MGVARGARAGHGVKRPLVMLDDDVDEVVAVVGAQPGWVGSSRVGWAFQHIDTKELIRPAPGRVSWRSKSFARRRVPLTNYNAEGLRRPSDHHLDRRDQT